MKYLAVIQARAGSTRLPGKIYMDLGGKSVLERVAARVTMSERLDEAVVATSFSPPDLKTVALASSLGLRVFAGSENDVLDRYYQCAKLVAPEYVVRVTGDCPLFDARLLDAAIDEMDGKSDYMAAISETLADGLDLEIMKFSALRDAWENARLKSEREHVTLYIKNHPEKFTLQDFICPLGNLNSERWSLDDDKDYKLISAVYGHFKDSVFHAGDVVAFLDGHPELRQINYTTERNEGLVKSLAEDGVFKDTN